MNHSTFIKTLFISLNSRLPFYLLLSFTPCLSNAQFGPQNIITACEVCNASSVYAADLDGDGDMDVLSASSGDNKLAWYENMGGGVFGPQSIISTQADGAQSVYATDLDGDGDMDVLSASWDDDKIAWYENMGSGVFGPQSIISTQADGARSVYAADLDGDGDMDVLSASAGNIFLNEENKIAWYENIGGGVFGPQSIISTQVFNPLSVYATDLDGDGDMDVLSASEYDSKIAWYQNMGGGVFGPQSIIATQAGFLRSVYAADLDGDGDMDVLSASGLEDVHKIAWDENMGGGVFGAQSIISTQVVGTQSVHAADLDGDGDMDVLSASSGKIAWYENMGGAVFGSQSIISTQANAQSVHAADLDGDGDMDVLSASFFDDKIAWYENMGGGVFGSQSIISTQANGARSVYAADLDGDGDMDVLSASSQDDKIAWYENLNITSVGAYAEYTNHLYIYPNPATTMVTLAFRNAVEGHCKVSLLDVLGRTVYRSSFLIRKEEDIILDCSQLAGGSYFLSVFHEKRGIVYNKKVVVQR